MLDSLSTFMRNIIDYAGTYPPANLDLETAYKNYVTYLHGDDNWMLGKFIVSAKKLISLSILDEFERMMKPIETTVLLNSENVIFEYYSSLNNDIMNIKEFNVDGFKINSFELKLPLELNIVDNFNKIPEFLDRTYDIISNSINYPAKLFIELGINDEWKYLMPIFIEILAEFRNKNNDVGYKMRTGGTTAVSFPTVEQVAFAIYTCNDVKIPFKATAGMHHPFRHFDDEIKTPMHGFLNVFGAGVITYKYKLSKVFLSQIISDEEIKNFKFDNKGFSWNNFTVTKDEIEYARNNFMTSFGCCSFDEPREDLRNINLLK